jgi:hypothetical protein
MNLGGAVRFNKSGLIFIAVVGFIILVYTFGGGGQERSKGNNGIEEGFISRSLKSAGLPFPYGRNHAQVSLKALLIAAIDVAQRGGLEVVSVRKGTEELEEEIKGNNNY